MPAAPRPSVLAAWLLLTSFVLVRGFGDMRSGAAQDLGAETRRRLLEVLGGDDTRIYPDQRISRTLQVGQVYFACTSGDSLVKNCVEYEYASEYPIVSFIVNRTTYEASLMGDFADVNTFTYDTVMPNSECAGVGCRRRLDFLHDVDWCIAFANTDVLSLNFVQAFDEPSSFEYEFTTCLSESDLPYYILQWWAFALSLTLAVFLCAWGACCQLGDARGEDQGATAPPKAASAPGGYRRLPDDPATPKGASNGDS